MKQPVYHKKLQKPSFPIQALLIANMLPLFGVVFLGWDAAAIVLLYRHRHLVARQSAPGSRLQMIPAIAQLGTRKI